MLATVAQLDIRSIRLSLSAAKCGRSRSAAAPLLSEFTISLNQQIARLLVGRHIMIEQRDKLADQRIGAAELGAQALDLRLLNDV